jgi:predicted DNA-binding transcriptional regulator AlpA
MKSRRRISAGEVAEILGCAKKTVYNGGAGTDKLTRIRSGRRQVRFLLWEVMAFAEKQENDAREKAR